LRSYFNTPLWTTPISNILYAVVFSLLMQQIARWKCEHAKPCTSNTACRKKRQREREAAAATAATAAATAAGLVEESTVMPPGAAAAPFLSLCLSLCSRHLGLITHAKDDFLHPALHTPGGQLFVDKDVRETASCLGQVSLLSVTLKCDIKCDKGGWGSRVGDQPPPLCGSLTHTPWNQKKTTLR